LRFKKQPPKSKKQKLKTKSSVIITVPKRKKETKIIDTKMLKN
jgi:hypothetical protein